MVARKLIYLLLFFGVNLSFASDNNKLTDISMRYTEPSSVIRPKDFKEAGKALAGFAVGACCLKYYKTMIFGTASWVCGLYFANQCNKNSASTNKKSYVKKVLKGSAEGVILGCLPKISTKIGIKVGSEEIEKFLKPYAIGGKALEKCIHKDMHSGVEKTVRVAVLAAAFPAFVYSSGHIGLATYRTINSTIKEISTRYATAQPKSFEDQSNV
jgi:hypothetical protein